MPPPPPPSHKFGGAAKPAAIFSAAVAQMECLRVMCDYTSKLMVRRFGDHNTPRARSHLFTPTGAIHTPVLQAALQQYSHSATEGLITTAPTQSSPLSTAGASASVSSASGSTSTSTSVWHRPSPPPSTAAMADAASVVSTPVDDIDPVIDDPIE